eukprot:SAG31_NODE_9815_length_1223_cov_3.746441_2_plen_102_part_01
MGGGWRSPGAPQLLLLLTTLALGVAVLPRPSAPPASDAAAPMTPAQVERLVDARVAAELGRLRAELDQVEKDRAVVEGRTRAAEAGLRREMKELQVQVTELR